MSEANASGFVGKATESRDYLPFLKWLIFICFVGAGLLILYNLGLIQIMLETDRSRISLIILIILGLTSVHCLYQTLMVSHERAAVRRDREAIMRGASGFRLRGARVETLNGHLLESETLGAHVANLVTKSKAQDGRRIDQTLLLRILSDKLRSREKLGWFVAEALLRLALLGTAVGFILMLIPISELRSFDAETLRGALAGMTSGMAVALNVTVAGIASALILKMEYYVLDGAVTDLFQAITEVTEVYVVSVLDET